MFTTISQNNTFYSTGILMAMSVVQASTGFPYFSNAMYQYMCNNPVHLNVDEIPDQEAKQFAQQVITCNFILSAACY